jgi:hypothetical protein
MAKQKSTARKAVNGPLSGVPTLTATDGDSLEITVDVEAISVPYTVVFDDRTLMYSLVDRRERVALAKGTHRVAWSFSHVEKNWKHHVTAKVNGKSEVVLDSRSEEKKDSPYGIGLALVVVS